MVRRRVIRKLTEKFLNVSAVGKVQVQYITDVDLVWINSLTGVIDKKPTRYVVIEATWNKPLYAGTIIAPHLYEWIFDGVDDRLPYEWPDRTVPPSGVYEWGVRDRVLTDGYSPNGLGDTSGGWWFIFLMAATTGAIFSITEEHGASDPTVRYSIGRLDDDLTWPQKIAAGVSGYSVETARSLHNITSMVDFNTGTMTHTVSSSLETLSSTTTFDPTTWVDIPYNYLALGQFAPSGYRKPSVQLSYAYLKHNNRFLLLADATFFDGTNYHELINDHIGTPSDGPTRIETEDKWLWIIENATGSQDVSLKWFPAGSYIVFVDSNDRSLADVVVTGPYTRSGLVPDIRMEEITESVSKIIAYIPLGVGYAINVKLLEEERREGAIVQRKLWAADDIGSRALYTEPSWSLSDNVVYVSGINLQANDVLAPHLYDWDFDGVDDYIDFGTPSQLQITGNLTTVARVRIPSPASTALYWLGKESMYLVGYATATVYWLQLDGTWQGGWIGVRSITDDVWRYVVTSYDGANMTIYVDSELDATQNATGSITAQATNFVVGSRSPTSTQRYKGKLSYVGMFDASLPATETDPASFVHIDRAHTVYDSTNLQLFVDPTFYDGSVYRDLSRNKLQGTPQGAPARVVAEDKWMWYLSGVEADNMVHLRFFPVGAQVRFYKGKSLIYEHVVGSDNDVIDPALVAGADTVLAIIP